MSATQIGLNAQDVTLRLIGPGDEADEDGNHVPEGQVSLVITDHVNQYEVYVTGTAQTLRGLVVEGLSLPVPDGVPLFDTV